jgi:hypothetical protein
MRHSSPKDITVSKSTRTHRCLSCGVRLSDRRRRYCSVTCRQRLRRKLNLRTGLLRALNTRYATFYITDRVIVLDILPYDSGEIFSFIFARSTHRQPADDFNRLADLLGSAWWKERRRTNRKYLASRYLLTKASRLPEGRKTLVPDEISRPAVRSRSLVHLQLDADALRNTDLENVIKKAYRRQAKKHHPDLGGDTRMFRRIHEAYEDLLQWSEEPSFTRRRGFPDKWFYDGVRNSWVQPTPVSRK